MNRIESTSRRQELKCKINPLSERSKCGLRCSYIAILKSSFEPFLRISTRPLWFTLPPICLSTWAVTWANTGSNIIWKRLSVAFSGHIVQLAVKGYFILHQRMICVLFHSRLWPLVRLCQRLHPDEQQIGQAHFNNQPHFENIFQCSFIDDRRVKHAFKCLQNIGTNQYHSPTLSGFYHA